MGVVLDRTGAVLRGWREVAVDLLGKLDALVAGLAGDLGDGSEAFPVRELASWAGVKR